MDIFQKIIDKVVPSDIVYEDDLAIAFRDIDPQAPIHVLIVPKKALRTIADVGKDDVEMLGHLFRVIQEVAAKEKITDYRLVVNNGRRAGQVVPHFHIHLLAGRRFGWPPG